MSYFRITSANVERSKADKFIAFFERIKPQLQDIPGYKSGDIIQTAHPEDDNMMVPEKSKGILMKTRCSPLPSTIAKTPLMQPRNKLETLYCQV